MRKDEKDEIVAGFRVLDTAPVPEYRGTAVYLEHEKTKCRVLHLCNDDEENFFCFGFKTLPSDSSGAAHVVEHAVLSGSREFPIKDPFLALLKGSVNTFMNAMTYPDKTVFPAASVLPQDYFNLMFVYGDAVFRPLMREETFWQEGCRLELDQEGRLSLGGVVYNEMTGSYSSHETIAGEWVNRGLLPDTPYRFDSGGEPEAIPLLTYEEFLAFHHRYYHPSNCLIFLYGNIPTEEQLRFLDSRVLYGFDPRAGNVELPAQPEWERPRRMERTSPLGPGESPNGKTTVSVSWLTVPVADIEARLTMQVLIEVLLGNAGAPLQKAILESGLGQDVSPVSGIDVDVSRAICAFSIRGSDADRSEEFEAFLEKELEALAREGLPADTVEAGIKQIEFRNREMKGGIPFGLRLMGRAYRGWIHGADPIAALMFQPHMERVKTAAGYSSGASYRSHGNGYLESLVRRWFLENRHRLTLTVRPDPEHSSREAQKIQGYLDSLRLGMDESDRERIRSRNSRLAEFESTPDDPGQVAKVPRLKLSDLPVEVNRIETAEDTIGGVPVYRHTLHTNGIVYVDFAFDVRGLGPGLSIYLPLFSRAVCGCGLPGVPWDQVARKLALKSGGVSTFLEANLNSGTGDAHKEFLFFRIKALREDAADAVALLEEMMRRADFQDRERIRDLILEQRNDFRASLQAAGHSLVSLRAAGKLADTLAVEEKWRGIDQYLFLHELAEALPDSLDRVVDTLIGIREEVMTRRRVIVNMTGTGEMLRELENPVTAVFQGLQAGSEVGTEATYQARFCETESFTVPSGVGYVGFAVPSAGIESPLHTFELLLAHILSTTLLWESVRMVGGAYGVSASNNGNDGVFTFSSYRDPKITETLQAYRACLEMVSGRGIPPEELEMAVISVAGREMRPLSPAEKSIVGFRRRLYGITDQLRQQKRDLLLSAGDADVRGAATVLLEAVDRGSTAVMSTQDAIRATGDHSLLSSMSALPL